MLDNPAAPQGAVLVQITGDLFKKWMKACGAIKIDSSNPFQIVAILVQDAWREHEHAMGGGTPPNWHLTMMSPKNDRQSTRSENFHFKAEFGKACSHYWHYTLYRNPTAKTWHWVGAPNEKIPETNQGGGGAGSDIGLLKSNLTLVEMQLRSRTTLEKGMSNKKRDALLKILNRWDDKGSLIDDNGLFSGGMTL